MSKKIDRVVEVLKQGGIILYPTEGVYGLGCDPFNQTAVLRLLQIKQRNINQGLILIVSSWRQAKKLIALDLKKCELLKNKTNYPVTWVFPATKNVPRWIRGKFRSIAIRVTTHKIAKALCQKFGGPIVSTSANLTGGSSIKNLKDIESDVFNRVDFIVPGELGNFGQPSKIVDARNGKVLRP